MSIHDLNTRLQYLKDLNDIKHSVEITLLRNNIALLIYEEKRKLHKENINLQNKININNTNISNMKKIEIDICIHEFKREPPQIYERTTYKCCKCFFEIDFSELPLYQK